jgi:hypothetical protein
MKNLRVVSLLSLSVILISCKEKPPTPDPNKQGGPIASISSPSSEHEQASAIPSDPKRWGAEAANREPTDPTAGKLAVHDCSASSSTAETVNLPPGTVLLTRANETLSFNHNIKGDHFSATVIDPVVDNQRTIIPAGSVASGTVVAAASNSKSARHPLLAVRLDSVCADGQTYKLQTEVVAKAGNKGERRSADFGELAGSSSAAVGGLIGAGAGTAGAAFTGNKDIVIPSESILRFPIAKAESGSHH